MKKFEQTLSSLILFLLKTIHIEPKETTVRSLVQFIKFGIVGVSNTLISYIIHVVVLVLLRPFGWKWDYLVGNVLAFSLSVLWSFYWNNKYVFTSGTSGKRSVLKTLLRTYIAYGFSGIFLSNILSYYWVEMIGISKYIAPLLNLIISVPVNFLINKFWAFKS